MGQGHLASLASWPHQFAPLLSAVPHLHWDSDLHAPRAHQQPALLLPCRHLVCPQSLARNLRSLASALRDAGCCHVPSSVGSMHFASSCTVLQGRQLVKHLGLRRTALHAAVPCTVPPVVQEPPCCCALFSATCFAGLLCKSLHAAVHYTLPPVVQEPGSDAAGGCDWQVPI